MNSRIEELVRELVELTKDLPRSTPVTGNPKSIIDIPRLGRVERIWSNTTPRIIVNIDPT